MEKDYLNNIKLELTDIITNDFLEDAYILEESLVCYSKKYIDDWLNYKKECPKTKIQLKTRKLIKVKLIDNIVADFKKFIPEYEKTLQKNVSMEKRIKELESLYKNANDQFNEQLNEIIESTAIQKDKDYINISEQINSKEIEYTNLKRKYEEVQMENKKKDEQIKKLQKELNDLKLNCENNDKIKENYNNRKGMLNDVDYNKKISEVSVNIDNTIIFDSLVNQIKEFKSGINQDKELLKIQYEENMKRLEERSINTCKILNDLSRHISSDNVFKEKEENMVIENYENINTLNMNDDENENNEKNNFLVQNVINNVKESNNLKEMNKKNDNEFIYECDLDQNLNQYLEKAELSLKNNRIKEALDIYLELDKKYPDNALINYNIGDCYKYLGDFFLALKYFRIANSISTNIEDPQYKLSELILEYMDDKFLFKEAFTCCYNNCKNLDMIHNSSDISKYHLYMGINTYLLNTEEKDKEVYFKALNYLEKSFDGSINPIALLYKGLIYQKLDFYLNGLGCISTALKIDSYEVKNNPNFHIIKGKLLIDNKSYSEAIESINMGCKTEFFNSLQINLKINSNFIEYKNAVPILLKEFECKNNTDNDYNKLGLLLLKLTFYIESLNCFNKAVELNPYESNYYNNKGLLLNEIYDYDQAILCFDNAIKLDWNNASFYSNKGNSLEQLSKFGEAIEYYDKAINLDGINPIYYNKKIIALTNLGKFEEADECIKILNRISLNSKQHAFKLT